jgi:hypothetical protein
MKLITLLSVKQVYRRLQVTQVTLTHNKKIQARMQFFVATSKPYLIGTEHNDK